MVSFGRYEPEFERGRIEGRMNIYRYWMDEYLGYWTCAKGWKTNTREVTVRTRRGEVSDSVIEVPGSIERGGRKGDTGCLETDETSISGNRI